MENNWNYNIHFILKLSFWKSVKTGHTLVAPISLRVSVLFRFVVFTETSDQLCRRATHVQHKIYTETCHRSIWVSYKYENCVRTHTCTHSKNGSVCLHTTAHFHVFQHFDFNFFVSIFEKCKLIKCIFLCQPDLYQWSEKMQTTTTTKKRRSTTTMHTTELHSSMATGKIIFHQSCPGKFNY